MNAVTLCGLISNEGLVYIINQEFELGHILAADGHLRMSLYM